MNLESLKQQINSLEAMINIPQPRSPETIKMARDLVKLFIKYDVYIPSLIIPWKWEGDIFGFEWKGVDDVFWLLVKRNEFSFLSLNNDGDGQSLYTEKYENVDNLVIKFIHYLQSINISLSPNTKLM